jgi:hypothetical protein
MINLDPRTLPVHCCCEPERRIGWVRMPANIPLDREQFVSFQISQPMTMLIGEPVRTPAREIHATTERLDLVVRPIETYICAQGIPHQTVPVIGRVLAVKSPHVEIAKWRKVVGFVEDKHGRDMRHGRLR